MRNIILLVFLLFTLVGCKYDNSSNITTNKRFLVVDKYLSITSHFIFHDNNDDYLFIYDSRMKCIRVISMKNSALIKIIAVKNVFDFETDEEVRTIFVKNFDSIFIAGTYYVRMIDSTSSDKFQFIYRKPNIDTFPEKAYGEFSEMFPLCYESESKSLFLRQYRGNVFLHNPKFYEYPLEASLNISDLTFKDLNEFYPKKYLLNFYGDLNYAYREIVGVKHILSFNAVDTIYTYNRLTKKVEQISCKSQYQKTETKPLPDRFKEDVNRKIEHILQSPYYLNIIYDKYRKCYYRFFLNGMALKKTDSTYNNISDKEKYLMVLDENLKLIKELRLPRNSLLSLAFVTEEGLMIRSGENISSRVVDSLSNANKKLKNVEKESILSFDIYKFNFN